jgi:hypothetical protein
MQWVKVPVDRLDADNGLTLAPRLSACPYSGEQVQV